MHFKRKLGSCTLLVESVTAGMCLVFPIFVLVVGMLHPPESVTAGMCFVFPIFVLVVVGMPHFKWVHFTGIRCSCLPLWSAVFTMSYSNIPITAFATPSASSLAPFLLPLFSSSSSDHHSGLLWLAQYGSPAAPDSSLTVSLSNQLPAGQGCWELRKHRGYCWTAWQPDRRAGGSWWPEVSPEPEERPRILKTASRTLW